MLTVLTKTKRVITTIPICLNFCSLKWSESKLKQPRPGVLPSARASPSVLAGKLNGNILEKNRSLEKKSRSLERIIYNHWEKIKAPLLLWSSGPLVLYSSGPVVLWSCGPLLLWLWSFWSCSPLALWSCDRLVRWSYGPLVL